MVFWYLFIYIITTIITILLLILRYNRYHHHHQCRDYDYQHFIIIIIGSSIKTRTIFYAIVQEPDPRMRWIKLWNQWQFFSNILLKIMFCHFSHIFVRWVRVFHLAKKLRLNLNSKHLNKYINKFKLLLNINDEAYTDWP